MTLTLYTVVMFFLCHIIGDFWLQSDWMAMNKSKKSWNCLVHVLIYTSMFLFLTASWKALLFIGVTHFILDRWHFILKRAIWWRNHFPTGDYPPFVLCDTTGYYDDSPYNTKPFEKYSKEHQEILVEDYGKPRLFFITMWLYIFQDNTLHLICNLIALTLLV
jgi:hypothetical protein